MLRKIILACIAVATIALAVPTEASARYYGYRGYYRYHGYRAWGPRYYGFYPRYRYRSYGFYPYAYGCWRTVMGPYGYWRRVWVCG